MDGSVIGAAVIVADSADHEVVHTIAIDVARKFDRSPKAIQIIQDTGEAGGGG